MTGVLLQPTGFRLAEHWHSLAYFSRGSGRGSEDEDEGRDERMRSLTENKQFYYDSFAIVPH